MPDLMMNFQRPQQPDPQAAALGTMLGLIAQGLAGKHAQIRDNQRAAALAAQQAIIPGGGEDAARAYSQATGTPINPGTPATPDMTMPGNPAETYQQGQDRMVQGQGPLSQEQYQNLTPAQPDVTVPGTPAGEDTIGMGGKDYPLSEFPASATAQMRSADAKMLAALNAGTKPGGSVGTWVAVKDSMGETTGYINNKTLEVKSRAQVGGLDPNMGEAPITSASKSMMEIAPKVRTLATKLRSRIESLKKEIGPAAGRWSAFWSGKIGAENPEYNKIRVDAGLLSTALMRMHVGARGGEQIMEHFTKLVGLGQQSPENMKAAMDEILDYADSVEGGHIKENKDGKGESSKKSDPLGLGL